MIDDRWDHILHRLGGRMQGKRFGRYRIDGELGAGGMGSVWRATDTLLGRVVALKLLSEGLAGSQSARERFVREARAASRLEHPGIAVVFDAGDADGTAYIAYQLVDGESLAARIARGAIRLQDAVRWIAEVADALDHAHRRGVLHRDLTAGNVLVASDGHAVVVDFGLARLRQETGLTTTGTVMGTAAYMAPEVVAGKSADERSDLYGLGVILYQLVSGHLPFESESVEAVLYRVMSEAPARLSSLRGGVPEALDQLVMRLLAKDPTARPSSGEEVAAELRAILAGGALSAAGGSPRMKARAEAAIGAAIGGLRWRLRRLARTRVGVISLAFVTLAVTSLLLLGLRQGWLPGASPSFRTIAVLPARNASPDTEETAYLAEGLGEELVARLSQVSGLRVLPWITTQRYADPARPLTETARELGADVLMLGSYLSDGERVRVTMSLVDGRTGHQRWSQIYEEHVGSLFALQRNIALGVVTHLKHDVSDPDRRALTRAASTSPEAYDFYLRGSAYLHAADVDARDLAGPFFQKALELDPNLAEAHVGIGAVYSDRFFRADRADTSELAAAEGHYRRALELDPRIAEARRGLIRVHWAREEMAKGLEVVRGARDDESVEGLLLRGEGYTMCGLPERAAPLFARALELDPANQAAAWFRVIALNWSGDHRGALMRGAEYLERFGEDPEIFTWMAVSAWVLGETAEARRHNMRALELFGDSSNGYAVNHAADFCRQLNDRPGLDSLVNRWLPVFSGQVSRTPGNYRARLFLIRLLCAAGRRAELHEQVEIVSRIARDDGAAGYGEVPFVIAGSGETELARSLLWILDHLDPLSWGMTFHASLATLGPGYSAFVESPEFRPYRERWAARMTEVRRKY